jgi:hypothetical protein
MLDYIGLMRLAKKLASRKANLCYPPECKKQRQDLYNRYWRIYYTQYTQGVIC